MPTPSWYRIPEIKFSDYVAALAPLYRVLEGEHTSKSNEDVFASSILRSFSGISSAALSAAEKQRQYEKALSMKMGDLHEELLGKLRGYVTLPKGHPTGCDVAKADDSEFWEVKNGDNTMNSSSAESVIAKLVRVKESGKTAGLILVHCAKATVPRFKAPADILVLRGSEAYARFSGRGGFFDDLHLTLDATFGAYKTHAALRAVV